MVTTAPHMSSSSRQSISSDSYKAAREVTPQDAYYNSYSSSQVATQCSSDDGGKKKGILQVRNQTPSTEPFDSTVIVKSAQKAKFITGVSSFGALKRSNGSSCATESTCEDENLRPEPTDSVVHLKGFGGHGENTLSTPLLNDSPTNNSKQHTRSQQSLKHWVRQLHRRHLQKKRSLKLSAKRMPLSSPNESEVDLRFGQHTTGQRHKKSSSWTSSAFVTAMKSASISLASFPGGHRRKSQGSELAGSESHAKPGAFRGRGSRDHSSETAQRNEEATLARATLRQHTLYEMMNTEASYIEGLKALVSTYRLIMDVAPSDSTVGVHRCILGILELHETLLNRLRELGIGIASRKPMPLSKKLSMKLSGHNHSESPYRQLRQRSRSLNDAHLASSDWMRRDRSCAYRSVTEPNDAARVAHIFDSMLSQFFVYEEYAATYTIMVRYLSTSTQQIPCWDSYERGLEALVNSIAPVTSENKAKNNSMTYGDLLIKPIQRICKYPLFFGDLLKYTPVIDDPESHAAIEKVLHRLRETTEEINKATTDEYTREKIARSWKLQDMLVFSTATSTPFVPRALGRVELCGTLYIAYQSSTAVTGDYMLCALFKSYFLLAKPVWGPTCICSFSIVACINLIDLKLEAADKGKGLRCNNTPFTWKLVFEFNQRLFEVILAACSHEEERQWRTQIMNMATKNHDEMHLEDGASRIEQLSLLVLDIESVGNAFLARRLSIQRTADSGARLRTRQVILKNTHSQNEKTEERPTGSSMKRSQSLLSGSVHTTVLCLRRSTRICIEQEMCEVWSTDFLPYPAMTLPRDRRLRRSASNVMRKFSKNSLTGSIGKRNVSGLGAYTPDDSAAHDGTHASHPKLLTKGTGDHLERRAMNSADNTSDILPAAMPTERPQVHFTREVLRKLPRKGTGARASPAPSSSPTTASPPKAKTRISAVSFEKLGALFKRGGRQ